MKFPAGYVPGVGVVKASAFGGVGEKLLKSMGWADGQGLGKEGTGMKNAIEVKKKEDTTGVSPRAGRRARPPSTGRGVPEPRLMAAHPPPAGRRRQQQLQVGG